MKEIKNPDSVKEYKENLKKILLEANGECQSVNENIHNELYELIEAAIKKQDKLIRFLHKLEAITEIQYEWLLLHNKNDIAEDEIRGDKDMILDAIHSHVTSAKNSRNEYVRLTGNYMFPNSFPNTTGDNK